MKYFDLGEQDLFTCEACGKQGNEGFDIHHIFGRGEGRDVISNLMCLCRKHHEKAHSTITKSEMQLIHNFFMQGQRKVFLK